MHIIDDCPRCGQSFMRHANDHHLYRPVAYDPETKEPVSWEVICQGCDEKERGQAKDVNDVPGTILCAKKGCVNNALEFHKYCQDHYDEAYPIFNHCTHEEPNVNPESDLDQPMAGEPVL